MRRSILVLPVLCGLAALPALAQSGDGAGKQPSSDAASNIGAGDTRTQWAPQLPAPAVDDNAPPAAFIDAAVRALAAGRTGEAQEAMERAESRALDRSVRPSKAGEPSQQALIQQIAAARQALSAGDRLGAVRLLEQAAKTPQATQRD